MIIKITFLNEGPTEYVKSEKIEYRTDSIVITNTSGETLKYKKEDIHMTFLGGIQPSDFASKITEGALRCLLK